MRLGASLLAFAAGGVIAQPAFAQSADTASTVGDVVVTARAGVNGRSRLDTSYAVTSVTEEALRMRNPMGVAEALKSVPGFWVEASGGEASANIRARGIPQEGFSAVALQEDGLPVQHDAGLGYLNADQSFRLDETVDRMEVVRGGPSSIFASYAPGGTINFITRRGGETFEGLVKAQVGDYGYYRTDAWVGGPIGDWRFGVGGFYRKSDGIRDPGFTADEGGQIRLSLGRDFERGSIDFNVKHFGDQVMLQAGVPLKFDAEGEPSDVPGFDALSGTLSGPETERLTLRGANGPFDWDLSRGTDVELTQYTAVFKYDLGAGWNFENRLRHRTSDSYRIGLFPNTPVTGAARIAQFRPALLASVPGATDVQLRYSTTGEVFDVNGQNGNGLVVDGSLRWVHVPLDETINDARLMRTFEVGGQSHEIALGFYVAKVEESFDRYSANTLLDVQENARRLDLVAVNAAGNVLYSATENGISRYGAEFADGDGESTTTALYLTDEWSVTDALRIDAGVRWEKIEFTGTSQGTATVNLGQSPSQADDTFLTGSGVFTRLDKEFDHLGWTLGVDWRFAPNMGLFARHTSTFRLPSLGDYITNAANTSPFVQEMALSEAGYKLSTPVLDLYATAFYTAYDSLTFGGLQFDSATGGYVSQTAITDTKTLGVELEGRWKPTGWFDLTFNATLQNPEFGDYIYYEGAGPNPIKRDFSGNQINRTPKEMFRLIPGVNLLNNRLRVELDLQRYGERFSDAANTAPLPAYNLVNATVRYDLTDAVSIYGYGTNLADEIGLTEGNPRAGQIVGGEAGSLYGIGRPEFGRSFRFAVMYRF